jgi:hypothetical protein
MVASTCLQRSKLLKFKLVLTSSNLKLCCTKPSSLRKAVAIVLEPSCLRKVVGIILPLLLQCFFLTRYNPFNSWQNNDFNNTNKYLKFRNGLKFYVPYFFSPLRTKHTHKKTNTNSYKTNSQHMAPNLGPYVGG